MLLRTCNIYCYKKRESRTNNAFNLLIFLSIPLYLLSLMQHTSYGKLFGALINKLIYILFCIDKNIIHPNGRSFIVLKYQPLQFHR